jgi:hypothetical protein
MKKGGKGKGYYSSKKGDGYFEGFRTFQSTLPKLQDFTNKSTPSPKGTAITLGRKTVLRNSLEEEAIKYIFTEEKNFYVFT